MSNLRFNDGLVAEPMEAELPRAWRLDLPDSAQPIRIDLSEADGLYLVKAELPGASKEDIDVRIDGTQVTISADVPADPMALDGSRILRRECPCGPLRRTISLPHNVDESRAAAKFRNGVLLLTLPKRAHAIQLRLVIE